MSAGVTYRMDACGECVEGTCDDCESCQVFAAMPGAKPHMSTWHDGLTPRGAPQHITFPWPSIALCATGYAFVISAFLGLSPLTPLDWPAQALVGFCFVVAGLAVSGRERA